MTEIGTVLQLVQQVLLKLYHWEPSLHMHSLCLECQPTWKMIFGGVPPFFLSFFLLCLKVLNDEMGCQCRTQLLTQSLCFCEDKSDSDSSSWCAFSRWHNFWWPDLLACWQCSWCSSSSRATLLPGVQYLPWELALRCHGQTHEQQWTRWEFDVCSCMLMCSQDADFSSTWSLDSGVPCLIPIRLSWY
jgi:hypothetical protein